MKRGAVDWWWEREDCVGLYADIKNGCCDSFRFRCIKEINRCLCYNGVCQQSSEWTAKSDDKKGLKGGYENLRLDEKAGWRDGTAAVAVQSKV